MTQSNRRSFVRGMLAAATAVLAVGTGLLKPRRAHAATWPRDAYLARTVEDALANLYGTRSTVSSDRVMVRTPYQANSGAVAPVEVWTDLPDSRSISVLVANNPRPLAAHLNLGGALPYFYANLKMRETSDVHFVVHAGGKLYSASKNIRVTAGGCG